MSDALHFTRHYLKGHAGDAARVLEELGPADSAAYLASLPAEEAARVMDQLFPWYLGECFIHLSPKAASERLDLLSSFRACHVLRQSDETLRQQLLHNLPKKKQKTLSRQITFRPDTVGYWMAVSLPMVSDRTTVQEALDHFRRIGQSEGHHFFVMQHNGQYVGAVELGRLIHEPPNHPVTSLLDPRVEPVLVQAPLISVRSLDAWHHTNALPVVNVNNEVEGLLKVEQMREALETVKKESVDTSLFESMVPLFLLATSAWVRGMVALPFLEPPKPPPSKENAHDR
ncbi:magnesium transporter MgtE N-terminal domain-containing protein [Nitrospina watsonii]|uniref:CBS domain-containing protein n=1 Tax=Nitrospina watsonii TaxID=1323948 RepID=A0ABN8VYG7_9BACT|nr:CBS domain-containing protein [Nitrospina watsonii]CAI2717113.1 protein of unknown function [Nitrospina watsonii]